MSAQSLTGSRKGTSASCYHHLHVTPTKKEKKERLIRAIFLIPNLPPSQKEISKSTSGEYTHIRLAMTHFLTLHATCR